MREDLKDWQFRWSDYDGFVRVVDDTNAVCYGKVLDHYTYDDTPSMLIEFLDGSEDWIHPRFVWPIGADEYREAVEKADR